MHRLILSILLIIFAQQQPQCFSRPTRGCRSSEHDDDIQRITHNITHSKLLLAAGAQVDQSRRSHAPPFIHGLRVMAVRKPLKRVSASTNHQGRPCTSRAQNIQRRRSQGPTDQYDDSRSHDIRTQKDHNKVEERKKKLVHVYAASAHIKDKDRLARSGLTRRQVRALVGSSPPKCAKKCGSCNPCKSVLVPIHSIPSTAASSEYYPEAWRCQCGGRIFSP